jgi:hypothetical protein
VEETQFGAMALGRTQRARCARPDRSDLGGVLIAAAKSIDRQPAQPRGVDNDDDAHTQQGAADRAR